MNLGVIIIIIITVILLLFVVTIRLHVKKPIGKKNKTNQTHYPLLTEETSAIRASYNA